MPILSIISINLNNAEGLKATMESVINQIFTDYEYIIIDGGSTDGSVEIIQQYSHKINYWISESDKGIYSAMNKGIVKAQGEYCLFLNSGDALYAPDILANVFKNSPREDILYGNIIFEGAKEAFIFPDVISFNTFLGASIGHNASFIKRNLFEKLGLYNENNKIVSDWEFFVNVFIKHKCSYRYYDEIITVMQSGGISTNSKYHAIQLKERMEAIKRVLPEFYDTAVEYYELKNELAYYKNSRLVQLIKKIQNSNLYKLRTKYLRIAPISILTLSISVISIYRCLI